MNMICNQHANKDSQTGVGGLGDLCTAARLS